MKVMDLSSFLEEMDNDLDDVNFIIIEFVNSITEQIPHMEKLLKDCDYTILSREAHSIKGGARNIMAPGLEKAAQSLEMSSKNNDLSESKKSLDYLKEEFLKFKNFVSQNITNNLLN